MAHDYKKLKEVFKAIAEDIGICEVVYGYNKSIHGDIKSPAFQFDSFNSVDNKEKNYEVYSVTADFLKEYIDNEEEDCKNYDDVWREIEELIDNFLDTLQGYEGIAEVLSVEIPKQRFGYGFTVNSLIPIRIEFQVKLVC